MSVIRSYPSIYNLGHKAVAELLLDPVLVQEKVDGSQISFGKYPTLIEAGVAASWRIAARSKGAELNIEAPDKMFAPGVQQILARGDALRLGWTYRGEYLAKPKHNALAYDRIPKDHIVVFDIDRGECDYLSHEEAAEEAARIGFEYIPVLHHGMVSNVTEFRDLLARKSFLGGQDIEGVVIKNYARFGPDKKTLMAKFVSEAFKEVHAAEWKTANPGPGDLVDILIAQYRNPARWAKAVQHLREAGVLEDSPRDIGTLFKEVPADIEKECAGDIKDALFAWAWPKIRRGACAGLAEWYKERLLEKQFETAS